MYRYILQTISDQIRGKMYIIIYEGRDTIESDLKELVISRSSLDVLAFFNRSCRLSLLKFLFGNSSIL